MSTFAVVVLVGLAIVAALGLATAPFTLLGDDIISLQGAIAMWVGAFLIACLLVTLGINADSSTHRWGGGNGPDTKCHYEQGSSEYVGTGKGTGVVLPASGQTVCD